MSVSLRRAAALQDEIRAVIQRLALVPSTEISIYAEDMEGVVAEAKQRFDADLARSRDLRAALYEIRRKVGAANAEAGITARLAEVAELTDRRELLENIVAHPLREDWAVIKGKARRLLTREEVPTGYGVTLRETVTTGLHDQAEAEAFSTEIKALRRQIQDLKDELLALNTATKITLSEAGQKVLAAEGLI